MAVYILLTKTAEDERQVTYSFGPDEATTGELRMDKETGEVEAVRPLPTGQHDALFVRAAVKVRQHRGGEFPDRLTYAS